MPKTRCAPSGLRALETQGAARLWVRRGPELVGNLQPPRDALNCQQTVLNAEKTSDTPNQWTVKAFVGSTQLFSRGAPMSALAPTIDGMSDDHGEADWQALYSESRIQQAINAAPDGPVTLLDPADYIPARVRRSTGHIIAYTPTHGLYDRVTAGTRYIQWIEAWRIERT